MQEQFDRAAEDLGNSIHLANAGGQVNGLSPAGAANGIQPQNQLTTARPAIAGTRPRTGNRAAITARIGNAR